MSVSAHSASESSASPVKLTFLTHILNDDLISSNATRAKTSLRTDK
jgi:hypothetical protein